MKIFSGFCEAPSSFRVMQNVMADESQVSVEVSEADLDGCPAFLVAG